MSQKQSMVNLILLGGRQRKATATGNNASWQCECDRTLPLIGRTGRISGCSEGFRVECPDCKRQYFVVPVDKDLGTVLEVREIEKD